MMVVSNTSSKTIDIGKKFSRVLSFGDVVAFYGELGAGKTTFIKGVLQGLGLKGNTVRSPSYTIFRRYKTKKFFVYHFDLYRVNTFQEVVNIGYDEYFYSPGGVTLIEWAKENLLFDCFKIKINFVNLNTRKISFSFQGAKYKNRKESLYSELFNH